MRTTAKDLRIRTKQLLDAVERGEEVVITHRGRPCAKLIPFRKPPRTKSTGAGEKGVRSPLFGIWKDYAPARNATVYVDKLREGRH
ncbi:MAG: type II toxin-antitoxin system Phd/YefM family antitoxin [Sulfuricaulis sp.]